ncbi:hypothetical protein HW130_26475 [Streptomyces sp. PKU-EA00015]|uniref:hypothetical protein n=1 Tax=Streptomyces sp. PKU-EA00015 TaxID=2748326 RepID=UPI0015A2CDDA|nr:hypothetical protein [Streptomyces sp. PKU-EA00015]NWF29761.1 hypothetical protein [Streptomyces sp. PKU-EA00015]
MTPARTTAPGVAAHLGTLGAVVLSGVRVLGAPPTDVLIHDGRIVTVGPEAADSSGTRRIDATELVMLPGLVDRRPHLRESGGEKSETIACGSRAAAEGGCSDVFAMADCDPVTDASDRVTPVSRTAARAVAAAACGVHPVGAITQGLAGTAPAPLAAMARAGARFFSDDGAVRRRPRADAPRGRHRRGRPGDGGPRRAAGTERPGVLSARATSRNPRPHLCREFRNHEEDHA